MGGGVPDGDFVGVSGPMLEPAFVLPVVASSCAAAPSSVALLFPKAHGQKAGAALAYCPRSSLTPATATASCTAVHSPDPDTQTDSVKLNTQNISP